MSNIVNIIVYDFNYTAQLGREYVIRSPYDNIGSAEVAIVARFCDNTGKTLAVNSVSCSIVEYYRSDNKLELPGVSSTVDWVINGECNSVKNSDDTITYSFKISPKSNLSKPMTLGYIITCKDVNGNIIGESFSSSSKGSQNPMVISYVAASN